MVENDWSGLQPSADGTPGGDAPLTEVPDVVAPEATEDVAPPAQEEGWFLPKDPVALRARLKELDEQEPTFREHARDIASRRVKSEVEDVQRQYEARLEAERVRADAAEADRLRIENAQLEQRRARFNTTMAKMRQSPTAEADRLKLYQDNPDFRADYDFFAKAENQRPRPSVEEHQIETRIQRLFQDAEAVGLPAERLNEFWTARPQYRQRHGTAVGEYDAMRAALGQEILNFKAWQQSQAEAQQQTAPAPAPATTPNASPPPVNPRLASSPRPDATPRGGGTATKPNLADLKSLTQAQIRARYKSNDEFVAALDAAGANAFAS